ncbi:MAG: cytochrome C oxidase subunit IV family protein [Candidatus Binatia bacterium]
MSAHAEDISGHVRIYIAVFAALAALTVITVAISYLHLPMPTAIAVALVVAGTKGSLVALYFMHLIDEKKVIYWLLGLTVVFFAMALSIPSEWHSDLQKSPSVWDNVAVEGADGGHESHDGGD